MRILIIVPRWFIGDIVNYRYMFPLGLAYISSALKQTGDDVDCLNLNHFNGPVDKIVEQYLNASGKYDFVCSGGISTFFNQIKSVVDAVRKVNTGARIIIGGGIISSEPQLMFNAFKPDYIVIGEGETTTCELMKCLKDKRDAGAIDGIGYLGPSGDLIINKPRAPIMDIDSLPYPDFEGFEFEKYLDHMHPSDQYFYDLFDYPRAYPIICSRSCPFLCTFCFHPIGDRYRQRSIDSIFKELETNVRRYRINIIAIYDELFSHDRRWLFEFCDRMKDFLRALPWECRWGCQMRVDKVDDEMLKVMKDAGCYMVSYGFESYSLEVLKSMKKHITPDQIDKAVHLTLKNKLSIQGNFIFGDAAETVESARKTLEYWEKHVDAGILLGFINPYPGTEIYQKCVERGVIGDKIDFIANHIFDVFNMSDTMTEGEFSKLWFEIFRTKITYRIYAKEWNVSAAQDGTINIHVKCPHCGEIIEYKNFLVLLKLLLFVMMYCRSCRRRFYVASRLYQSISKLLVLLSALTPGITYHLFRRLWSFLKKNDIRFKKFRLGGLIGKLSDED